MPDPVIAGFAALVRHRKRIEWPDPDLAMLADHLDDAGLPHLAEFVRDDLIEVWISEYSPRIDLRRSRIPNHATEPSGYERMMSLYRLLNSKEYR